MFKLIVYKSYKQIKNKIENLEKAEKTHSKKETQLSTDVRYKIDIASFLELTDTNVAEVIIEYANAEYILLQLLCCNVTSIVESRPNDAIIL